MQGTGFHTAAQMWENMGRDMSPEATVAIFHAEYDRLISEELEREPEVSNWLAGGRVNPADDIVRRRERGADQVLGYIGYSLEAPERPWEIFDGTPALEVEFEVDFEGVAVRGFIDQVIEHPDGSILPRDLKTGTKLPEWDIQLGVYGLALQELFGLEIHYGDFYMAKNNAPTTPSSLSRFTREYLTGLFHNLDAGINAGAFLPNPGNCGTCSVADYCTAIGSKADFPIRRISELSEPAAAVPAADNRPTERVGDW